jgi:hypothetical protein
MNPVSASYIANLIALHCICATKNNVLGLLRGKREDDGTLEQPSEATSSQVCASGGVNRGPWYEAGSHSNGTQQESRGDDEVRLAGKLIVDRQARFIFILVEHFSLCAQYTACYR